jgi:hypothetical protein
MSDYKPILRANFINRRTGEVIADLPMANHISLNLDMRQLSDTFDFDFMFRRDDSIDLRSHDFVEFFFKDDSGIPFQVAAGFIQTIATETGANTHRYQANGNDFLGQLLNLPFLIAKPVDQTTVLAFTNLCLSGGYLNTYLNYKGLQRSVVDRGIYPGTIQIQELTDAKRGPVLQQTLSAIYNTIYQDRFGRAVIYGRDNRYDYDTDQILSEYDDANVESMQLRRDYSKVFSECKILYTGGAANVNYALQPSMKITNGDPDAADIFNPEIRTFQTSDLLTTPGNNEINNKMNALGASIIRQSNQNLRQFVVKTNKPFFIDNKGTKTWYEKGQIFYIFNESQTFYDEMMLCGIQYTQDAEKLSVQLMFIPVDSLI